MNGPEQWMRLARTNHQNGNLTDAEALYRRTLKAQPDHAEAAFLLGVTRAHRGDLDEAESLLRSALDRAPDPFSCRLSLANILCELRRFEESIVEYDALIGLEPQRPLPRIQRARTLRLAGRIDDAITALDELLITHPDMPAVLLELGLAHNASGAPDRAEIFLRRALERRPDHPAANSALGSLLAAAGKGSEAVGHLRIAAAAMPRDFETAVCLAGVLADLALIDESVVIIERLCSRNDLSANQVVQLADLRRSMNQASEAEALYRRVLAQRPGHVAALYGLACVQERSNRPDEALLTLTTTPDVDRVPAALLLRARLYRRLRRYDEALETARAASLGREQTAIGISARMEEGNILDRMARYDDAMACVLSARRDAARAAESPSVYFDRIRELHSWLKSADINGWKASWPSDDFRPIFVMGFPRSGTTLVEAMLSAHPALVGTDEAPLVSELIGMAQGMTGVPYPDALTRLTEAHISSMHEAYRRGAAAHIQPLKLDGHRLVDKLPLNVPNLPAIRRVFPDAPVVLVRRDPRDAIVSCLMQHFQPGQAIAAFDTPEELARLHLAIDELWCDCVDRLGLNTMEIRYEDLVSEPEPHMRRLFAFIGVDWDDCVLRFHENAGDRTISTPSYAAVARGVFTSSCGRWRHYADHLARAETLLSQGRDAHA